ncbi:hypothetical protein CDAR_217761 [Caerostris darwini]|uniref:Uncharacterized protein n=1 Tax=Caerostris darwini TaxID=1538125 RepID=A0AAV4MWF4_9ARAC|nr:hypothetical protein CDAR_217761 [Caerostris darwini]
MTELQNSMLINDRRTHPQTSLTLRNTPLAICTFTCCRRSAEIPETATTHDGCRINSTRNCSVIGTRERKRKKRTTVSYGQVRTWENSSQVSLTNSVYLCCLVKARNELGVIHLATLPVLVCSAMCDDDFE